jgi:transposase-like protein
VRVEALFKGRQFDQAIIVLRCRSLISAVQASTRDLVEMMAERGVSLAHTTILRRVQHYLRIREMLGPLCAAYGARVDRLAKKQR